jgi:hypothetical protein
MHCEGVAALAYRFRRLGLDDELVLLEILRTCELLIVERGARRHGTLKVIFMVAVGVWMLWWCVAGSVR